jgi:hypothetical protein
VENSLEKLDFSQKELTKLKIKFTIFDVFKSLKTSKPLSRGDLSLSSVQEYYMPVENF